MSSYALKWLSDSLLELLIAFDPVTNDADHYAQLGHHFSLLQSLSFYSQWGKRRNVLWGYIPQLLLNNPGSKQIIKNIGLFLTLYCGQKLNLNTFKAEDGNCFITDRYISTRQIRSKETENSLTFLCIMRFLQENIAATVTTIILLRFVKVCKRCLI